MAEQRQHFAGTWVVVTLLAACGGPDAVPLESPALTSPSPVLPSPLPDPTSSKPGATLWARHLEAERGLDVLAAQDGSFALLAEDDDPASFDGQRSAGDLVLARYDGHGALLTARGMSAPWASVGRLAAASDGFYVMAEVTAAAELGCGPIAESTSAVASVVARLSADGTCRWAQRKGYLRALTADTQDGLWMMGDSGVVQADGAGRPQSWQNTVTLVGGRGNIDLHAMARVADGSLVLAGTSNGDMRLAGQAWSGQVVPVLFRMSAEGEVQWARPLPGLQGSVSSLQVTSAGTLLALGAFTGPLHWAGASLSSEGLSLLALGADGTELWARSLGMEVGRYAPPRLAVDAAGGARVMVQSAEACAQHGVTVASVDGAGTLVWRRDFVPERCEGEVQGTALAVLPSGETVLTGAFTGSVDFGGQVLFQKPGGTPRAFLLKLAP